MINACQPVEGQVAQTAPNRIPYQQRPREDRCSYCYTQGDGCVDAAVIDQRPPQEPLLGERAGRGFLRVMHSPTNSHFSPALGRPALNVVYPRLVAVSGVRRGEPGCRVEVIDFTRH